MDELERLTGAELLALAALARLMVRLDGRFTPDEERALAEIGDALAAAPAPDENEGAGPYREASPAERALGATGFFELIELAGEQLPDDDSVRQAVRAVDRAEGREAIYGLLGQLALANPGQTRPIELLEWLAKEWHIQPSRPDQGA